MQVKEGLGYTCDPDTYFYGICEEFEGSLDKGADPMTTIDLIDRLGAKSMRIWMHQSVCCNGKGIRTSWNGKRMYSAVTGNMWRS